MGLAFSLLLALSCLAQSAWSETLDDVLEGFGEEKTKPEEADADVEEALEGFEESREEEKKDGGGGAVSGSKPSIFSLDGFFKEGLTYNLSPHRPAPGTTDWRGLSRLRSELQLELNARLSPSWKALVSGKGTYDAAYRIRGRDRFTGEVLDEYENDLKAGRQILVWGKSENIRITDVLNPLDQREPGLTDIEDLRLPVAMTRLDYYQKILGGRWGFTGVAIPEIRFDKRPVFGHDFFPSGNPLPPEAKPADSLDNMEFAFSAAGVYSGWDIAFYLADIYNDTPNAALLSPGKIERRHARLKMLGTAFNLARGNWLWKAEAAFFDGIEFFNASSTDFSRLDMLAGIEYSGFKDTTVSFEAANRHLFDFEENLKQIPDRAAENEFQTVFRLTRKFRHDTVTLTAIASTFGLLGEDGGFQRLSAKYDITDAVSLTGGIVLFRSGDLPIFRDAGDNDRVFLELKYSF
jgi:hypothetical protein